MVCVEGCWVANVNKLMFVLSGCCPGDIIKTTDHLHLPHLLAKYRLSFSFHHFSGPAIVCWSPHLLRAGPGLWNVIWEGNGSDWQCIDWLGGWGVGRGWGRTKNGSKCFLWFGIQQAACTIRWFLIPFNWARWRWTAGRGATGWDNPAAATRHTLKFRPSISIGLPICNADQGPRLG